MLIVLVTATVVIIQHFVYVCLISLYFFIRHLGNSINPGHHLPVLSHRPFPNLDSSEGIYSDSVSFSAHHQQTCTARVQTALKRERWENKSKVCLSHTHFKHMERCLSTLSMQSFAPQSPEMHIYWPAWEHRHLIWQLPSSNPLPTLTEATPAETISV